MLTIVNSLAINGLDGQLVRVEVDASSGLPGFDIVGLPDAAVREAKDRVRAALKNSGFKFPARRITVNLAPADIKKEGPVYDLPISLGILSSTEQIDPVLLQEYIFLGELSLNGSIRVLNGVLPRVSSMTEKGPTRVVVPAENANDFLKPNTGLVIITMAIVMVVRCGKMERDIGQTEVTATLSCAIGIMTSRKMSQCISFITRNYYYIE